MTLSKEMKKELERSRKNVAAPVVSGTSRGSGTRATREPPKEAAGDRGRVSGAGGSEPGAHGVEVLLDRRLEAGLTQAAAANLFGVTEKTWRAWEQNGPSRYGQLLLEKEGWL